MLAQAAQHISVYVREARGCEYVRSKLDNFA